MSLYLRYFPSVRAHLALSRCSIRHLAYKPNVSSGCVSDKRFNERVLTTDAVRSINEKLRPIDIQPVYYLKELVELYCEDEDLTLLEDIRNELLSLYEKLHEHMEKPSKDSFDVLRSHYKRATQDLFTRNLSLYCSDEIFLEVKGGVGGEEANRFAKDLFNMYEAISYIRGFEFNAIDTRVAHVRGGTDLFKYEFGVHRVQRIPINSKKIHTSSATVAVVPYRKIGTTDLKPSDLIVETMRSSGAGGQSVNKSETAVRITHIPTGIVVQVQDTSSQIYNKSRALQLLSEALMEREEEGYSQIKRMAKLVQYTSGDRSERIRSYQFIHDTVTDHRCNVTVSGVESVLRSGCGLDSIHDALKYLDDIKVIQFVTENLDSIIHFLYLRSK